ncbi:hypothetical protein [Methanooceanicella nereidis]|nr:hypothetical protein [Methanocella sp. CWC-04]
MPAVNTFKDENIIVFPEEANDARIAENGIAINRYGRGKAI